MPNPVKSLGYIKCHSSSSPSPVKSTTGIQSGPHAFDKSRFIMNFLTILRVTEILCSFKLVLEGKTRKEIPESKNEKKS